MMQYNFKNIKYGVILVTLSNCIA